MGRPLLSIERPKVEVSPMTRSTIALECCWKSRLSRASRQWNLRGSYQVKPAGTWTIGVMTPGRDLNGLLIRYRTGLFRSDHLTDTFSTLLFPGHLLGSLLRIAPIVEDADLMNALERASRSAPFLRVVLTIEIFHRVLGQRNARIPTLLRTPVDQPLFTNVEVP